MSIVYTFYDSDGVTPLSVLNLSSLRPGKTLEKKLYVSASEDVENAYISFFPGLKNKTVVNTVNSPVSYSRVMKQDTAGNIMKVDVAKETASGELTKKTDRITAFFYNGSTYTDVSSGNITFPKNTTEKLYLGCDYIYRNIYSNQTTPDGGSGLVFKYYNLSNTAFTDLPVDATDGTSGQTVPGTYFLGTLTPTIYGKSKINNKYKYWIEVSRTTTTTTPAICDILYWDNVFQFSKSCLFGEPKIYVKSADVTPIYTENTDAVYIYGNLGEVVYDSDPLSVSEVLTSDFSYKLPEISALESTIIFNSSIECAVDGGTGITVVSDGETDNTNVISGINFRFNSSTAYGDTFTALITELLKHLWYATDNYGTPNTYQNFDLFLKDYLYADSPEAFWVKFAPPSDMSTLLNSQCVSAYCYGTEA